MSAETVRFTCLRCGKPFRAPRAQVEQGGGRLGVRCAACGKAMRVRWAEGQLEVEPLPDGAAPSAPAAGAAPPGDLAGLPAAGARIGRYELKGLAGRGGMGAVYRAFDPAGNRTVALKLLAPGAPEEAAARFQREIEVQGNIHHPHLMPIFDSGEVDGQRYYTMELLREPFELSQLILLARSGEAARAPRLRALSTLEGLVRHVLLPVCEAVHHANVREGVLHRDLTPSNVLVDAIGLRPYVIDFGICALLEKHPARLSRLSAPPAAVEGGTRRVTGTLTYMPPEQLRGQHDRRGDVWGLGALLHAIVTGEAPLAPAVKATVPRADRLEGLALLIEQAEREGDLAEAEAFRAKRRELEAGRERTAADLQRDILEGRYQPRPLLDAALESIIAKALSPDPAGRYRNARALGHDLAAWLEGRAVEALVERHRGLGRWVYRLRLSLRRNGRWIAAAAAALALGAGGLALLGRGPTGPGLPERKLSAAARWREASLARPPLAGAAREAFGAWVALDPSDPAPFEALAGRQADDELQQRRAERERLLGELGEAERSGDPRRLEGAVAQVVALAERTGEEGLLGRARGERPLTLTGPGAAAFRALRPVSAEGAVGPAQPPAPRLPPGRWIVVCEEGGQEVWTPVELPRGEGALTVGPVPAPAGVPAGMVFVPAGRVEGPTGDGAVPALLWERNEVSVARYAAWLATLPLAEQELRVPRLAGLLGEAPRPLWRRTESAWAPPGGTNPDHPVEGVSVYDARAFAAAQGRRLPTAAEWAWAASGPFRLPTAAGSLARAFQRAAAPTSGAGALLPHAVGTDPEDVSPFGVRDLAGNVAEWTGTLATVGGVSGWLVMGGGTGLPPERALVARAQPEPGWRPLQGVGIRLVVPPAP